MLTRNIKSLFSFADRRLWFTGIGWLRHCFGCHQRFNGYTYHAVVLGCSML